MTVKELKEELNTLDENMEILIRFAVSEEDELGYYLKPISAEKHINEVYLYAQYDTIEEDCNFIGQKDLKKLWEDSMNEDEKKAIEKNKQWRKNRIDCINKKI